MRKTMAATMVVGLLTACGNSGSNDELERENAELREQLEALQSTTEPTATTGTTTTTTPTTTTTTTTTTALSPSTVVNATSPAITVPAPEPDIELLWFGVDPEFGTVRFLAEIKNPGDTPIVGLATEWTAYDGADAIVGNFRSTRSPIPANDSHFYVGGAGTANLSGTPTRVTVAIVDAGRFDADAPDPQLDVSGVEVLQDFSDTYVVTAVASNSDRDVRSADLLTALIVRDDNGNISLAEFSGDIFAPEVIPAGQQVRVEFRLFNQVREPATVEVFVWTGA